MERRACGFGTRRPVTRWAATCLGLGLLAAPAAHAVVLDPGDAAGVSGTASLQDPTLASVSVRDDQLPFEIRDGADAVVSSGVVRRRVTRETTTGTLRFSFRIENDASSAAPISSFAAAGYANTPVDADWRPDSFGDRGPDRVERSAAASGAVVTFRFDPGNEIQPGEISRSMYVRTNAIDFEDTGFVRIRDEGHHFAVAPAPKPVPVGCGITGRAEVGRLAIESTSFAHVEFDSDYPVELERATWDTSGTLRDIEFQEISGLFGGVLAPYVASVIPTPATYASGDQVFGFQASGFEAQESVELRFGLGVTNSAWLRCPGFDCGPAGIVDFPFSADWAGTRVILEFSDGSVIEATYTGVPGRNSLSSELAFTGGLGACEEGSPLPISFETDFPYTEPEEAMVSGDVLAASASDFNPPIAIPDGDRVAILSTRGGSSTLFDMTGNLVLEHDTAAAEFVIERRPGDPGRLVFDMDVLTDEALDGSYPDAFRVLIDGVKAVPTVGAVGGPNGSHPGVDDFDGVPIVGPNLETYGAGRRGFRRYVVTGISNGMHLVTVQVADAGDASVDTAVVIDGIDLKPGGSRCGLGADLVLLIPIASWLRGRRRSR